MDWLLRWKLGWIKVADASARAALSAANRVLFRQDLCNMKFRRIVVYRIGNIGDVLVTLPALDAIRTRFPDAHITLLTSPGRPGAPGAEQVMPSGNWFDQLLVYYTADVRSWRRRWSLLRRLREGEFELFIELPNQLSRLRDELRNMLAARLAGCRWAVGFAISQQRRFLREQALHISQERESIRIYRSVAGKLGLGPYREPRLPVSSTSRNEIAESLRRVGISENEPFVVVHPGAKRNTNRWPLERFASVADEIVQRWGTRVVLTGGPSELPLVEQVVSMMQSRPTVLCGALDLPRMAALLERASLYVGNDTGPMHLAAAVGTPVVGIFGARDLPNRWYPVGVGHSVLRRDVPCSPCFKEICDQDLICLRGIETEQAIAAVERQFMKQGPGARSVDGTPGLTGGEAIRIVIEATRK